MVAASFFERWYLTAKLHGVTSQKTVILLATVLTTGNHKQLIYLSSELIYFVCSSNYTKLSLLENPGLLGCENVSLG